MPRVECPTCKGKKYNTVIDFMSAKTVKKPCGVCQGTGTIEQEIRDGIRVSSIEAITYFFQYAQMGRIISTLEVRMRPVTINGVPQIKQYNPMFCKAHVRLYCEVVRMNTRPEYRKKGIMSLLLDQAMRDPKIEWFETNWDDSTIDGRNLLIGKGYKQEGDKLIWDRADHPEFEKELQEKYGANNGNGDQQPGDGGNSDRCGEGAGGSVSAEDSERAADATDESPSPPVA